jgi:hypothetical protein
MRKFATTTAGHQTIIEINSPIFEPKGLRAISIGQRPMDKITRVAIKALKGRKILTPF